jgi:hypothetical protein
MQVITTRSPGLSYGLALSEIGDLYLSSGNDAKELQIFRKATETTPYIDQGWVVSMPYNSGLVSERLRRMETAVGPQMSNV